MGLAGNNTMPNKEDRRVQRTRQLHKDVLVALIEERDYEAVTLKDVGFSAKQMDDLFKKLASPGFVAILNA
jgi:hypothetical protein